ncbi:hypothetical protein RBI80_11495 [Klebsiella variicola]|nr:hypothetical protein RBI80_11495 [Klebsiella variicola]
MPHNRPFLSLPRPHRLLSYHTSRTRPPRQSFSLRRLFSYSRREALELRRDPVRSTLALLGTVILMFIMGYGISMDVEDLRFAVLDRDQTLSSQGWSQNHSRFTLLYRAGATAQL